MSIDDDGPKRPINLDSDEQKKLIDAANARQKAMDEIAAKIIADKGPDYNEQLARMGIDDCEKRAAIIRQAAVTEAYKQTEKYSNFRDERFELDDAIAKVEAAQKKPQVTQGSGGFGAATLIPAYGLTPTQRQPTDLCCAARSYQEADCRQAPYWASSA